jgi:hypothetical protein
MIIRREFEAPAYFQEHLQKMALQVMKSDPRSSIEPLLSLVRDKDGNLVSDLRRGLCVGVKPGSPSGRPAGRSR